MSSSFTRSHARSCLDSILHPTNPANFELVFASHPQWPLPNPNTKPSISIPFSSSSSPNASPQISRKLRISCLDSSFNPPTSAHLDMALAGLPPITRKNDKDLANNDSDKKDEGEEYDALLLLLSAKNVDKVLKSGDATFEQRLEMIYLMAQHILKLGSPDSSVTSISNSSNTPQAWSNVAIGLLHEPAFVNKDKAVREFLKNRQEPAKPVHDVQLAWLLGTDTVVRFFDQKYYPVPLREALDPFFNSSTPSILIHFPRPVSSEEPITSSPHVHLPDGALRQAIIRGGQDRSDVSSSLVRSLITRNTEAGSGSQDWKKIVPGRVAEFVETERLYI